ncbi:MAG: SDR family NAD(P)-dependent oxidoreductase [Rhodobacterales bacterium]|nr:SDR family NAD(P)-dependent oxidoreductase [Rhodobacterales bacterium]
MFNLAPIPVPALTGRTVLVTGAGRGIGAALVQQLVAAGAQVFAGFYGAADMGALAGAVTFPLDVTDQSSVNAAVAQVTAFGGRLDVLVNNAGIIAPIGHLEHLPSDALRPAFDVNVTGLHRMTVACLPLLKASRGTIVNAGTGAATTPMEGWTAYCASKAAARMMTQMMALELAPHGIQSFFIGIPPTDTMMQGEIRVAGLNPISQIPQDKLVAPDVPASVMAWLCSAEARAVDEVLLDVRQDRFTAMMAL